MFGLYLLKPALGQHIDFSRSKVDAKYYSFLRVGVLFIFLSILALSADSFAFTRGRRRRLLLVFLLDTLKGQV